MLHGDAKWEEFEWNTTGLTLRGKAYPIARVLLVPIHPKEPEVEAKAAVKEEAAVEAGTADKQAEGKGEAPQTDGAGAAGAPPPPPQATVEGAAAVAVGAAAAQGDGGAAVTPPVAPAVAQ